MREKTPTMHWVILMYAENCKSGQTKIFMCASEFFIWPDFKVTKAVCRLCLVFAQAGERRIRDDTVLTMFDSAFVVRSLDMEPPVLVFSHYL